VADLRIKEVARQDEVVRLLELKFEACAAKFLLEWRPAISQQAGGSVGAL